jgi:GNAT superfamily N-acetyltransferase
MMSIHIEPLRGRDVTVNTVDALNRLLEQLMTEPRNLTALDLLRIVDCPTTTVLLARHGVRIVGTVTLVVPVQLAAGKVWAEDLVVESQYRNQGIAQQLMEEVIKLAEGAAARKVYATSSRVPSQKLVESIGFKVRQSLLFELRLPTRCAHEIRGIPHARHDGCGGVAAVSGGRA